MNLIGIAIRQSAHPQGIAALTLALSRRERELIEELVETRLARESTCWLPRFFHRPGIRSLLPSREKGWG
ncbi:hypothetical protein CF122_00730 [Aeromonas media]|nr:hypothetical protein CF122_00730 [Aeromonas media]